MTEAIFAALRPVRSRQQRAFAVRCVTAGLVASAGLGLAAGVGRFALGYDLPVAAVAGLLLAGPALGLLVGVMVRRNWHDAAEAVDQHYGLKDRAVTALAFASTPATDLHALQLADAAGQLAKVEPKAVVPVKPPRAWPAVLAAGVAAVAALVWPLPGRELEAGPAPVPEHILAVAADQKERLATLDKKLTDTANDLDDDKADDTKKGLKELLAKLAEKAEQLTEAGTDEREALAKLSEMQAEMQAQANQLDVAGLDGALSSLGAALAASQAFEGAGKALQEGKLEKAAKELDKLDEVKLTPKEAKALEEKLKQVAKQMGDAGQGSLSDAVAELADSLRGGKEGAVSKAARTIGKKVSNAIKRKKINDLLLNQLQELQESKCECQNNGGARIRQKSKSDNPSSNWGRGISGNIDGEKTRLGGKRTEVQLNGTPGGEGESEVETTSTPEARQRATREYRERFQKFKRESEAVLEGEPIPLGHRQTVKRYFESIRPANSDTDKDKKAEPEKKPDAGK
jgi:hypothetical protein